MIRLQVHFTKGWPRAIFWGGLVILAVLAVGGLLLFRLPQSPTLVTPVAETASWVHGGDQACDTCHGFRGGEQVLRGMEALAASGETEPSKGGEEEGEGGAERRASLFIRQRAYPLDSVPLGARYKAYEEALKMTQPRLSATERWENIGPAPMRESTMGGVRINVSGRVTAIALDPRDSNTAYVGAALGGVWKTTNAGKSWTPLTDNQASLATGAIAIDPSKPNTIYVGTGEPHGSDSYYGAGLLKSVNGGQSWTLLGAREFSWAGISSVIVDPRNPQIIYVATANYTGGDVVPPLRPWAGVFRSNDGGQTWTRLLGCDYDGAACRGATDLVMNPHDSKVLYAAFWGSGIYRTTDGGAKWQQVDRAGSNVARIELAIGNSKPAVLYAGYSIVSDNYRGVIMIKSPDAGTTWMQLPQAPNYCASQCNYDNVIAVHPQDSETVFVGGSANYIWEPVAQIKQVLQVSYDGGTSWHDLSPGDRPDRTLHPDMHVITLDPRNPDVIWAGTDGGVRRSTDGGDTWQDANGNLATLQFTGVAAHPTDPKAAFGGMQDNNKAKTTGSSIWQALDAGDGGFAAIDPFNPRYYYGTRYSLQFQRNDSSGSPAPDDWPVKVVGIDRNDRMLFYPPFAVDPSTQGVLYWGTHRLYRTTNRGDSWQPISSDLTAGWAISAISVAPTAAGTIYVGSGDGKVSVTKNTGGKWTNVTKAPLPNRYVSDFAVVHGAPGTAYVVYNGFNQHTPTTPGHVFKTSNFGNSWANISANLPDVPVLTIALDRDNPGVIYIGTDIGVFRSRDDGRSWEQFNPGMANCAVTDLAINPDTDVLLAATHGRSIYRLSLAATPSQTWLVRLPLLAQSYRRGGPATATPTATKTAIVSLPTATMTPKVTVTPTSPPPPLAGAIATFGDGFGDPTSGWFVGALGYDSFSYGNGEYTIATAAYDWQSWSWAPTGPHKDGIFQVKARQENSGAIYGLIFGSDSEGSAFYAFYVYPDQQQYALMLADYGWQEELAGWTYSPAIAAGTGINALRVVRSGTNIQLFCNNQLLTTVAEDPTLSAPGWAGLINWSVAPSATSHFDDFGIATPLQVAVWDDFSNPASGWASGASPDGYCSAAYSGGQYALNTSSDAACYSLAPTSPFVNGVYEVTARRAESTYPTAYGIMFGVDQAPPTSYFLFWLNPDSRQYCLLGFDGFDLYSLVKWTTSAAINSGVGSNRLRVIRDGVQMHLYVNDVYLTSFAINALLENGYLGLINWASPYEPIASFFDDFRVSAWAGAAGLADQESAAAGVIGSPPLPLGPFHPMPTPDAAELRGRAMSSRAPERP